MIPLFTRTASLSALSSSRDVTRYTPATGTVYETIPGGINSLALFNLSQMPDFLAALWQSYNAERIRVNTEARQVDELTADALQRARTKREALLNVTRAEFLQGLGDIRGQIKALETEAKRDIALAMGRPDLTDPAARMVRESQEVRLWNRLKPILDRHEIPALPTALKKITDDAMANVDADTWAVLHAELGSYIEARGEDPARLLALLDEQHARADPTVAEAIQARNALEVGCYQLGVSLGALEYAVESGSLTTTICAWEKGRTLPRELSPLHAMP